MKIEEVEPSGEPLVLAAPADVDALAAKYWISFPNGYQEFVCRLGEGVLGDFIRIYPPWRIEKELEGWRARLAKFWFWDAGRAVLPKERGVECIIIGDTVHGDEVVFHPARPNNVFVLPRDSDMVFDAGPDLLTAVEWIRTSGEIVEPIESLAFEPFDSRLESESESDAPADPPGESLDDIVKLAERWAKRHKTRAEARRELKKQTPKDATAELLYEGVIFNAERRLDIGYGIRWKILGAAGKPMGLFHWGCGENHSGYGFEPFNQD